VVADSPPVNTTVRTTNVPEVWGLMTDGMQAGLRMDKAQWKTGEIPIFKIDLKSETDRPFPGGVAGPSHEFEVVIDGQDYQYDGPDLRSVIDTGAAKISVGIHLAITRAWRNKLTGAGLELGSGKHTICVAFLPRLAEGNKTTRTVSNPVEIEILPAE